MHDDFGSGREYLGLGRTGTALREGTERFAEAVRPAGAEQIRARGEQRRRRQVTGSAAFALLAVAGLLGGYEALGAAPGSPTGVSDRGLALVAPVSYLAGVPSAVTFAISGTGRRGTVRVEVNLGRPRYAVYRKPVVLRKDPATGRWLSVPVVDLHGDWRCAYQVRVPAWTSTQHLLVEVAEPAAAPPWGAGRVTVRVFRAGALVGAQSGRPARLRTVALTWQSANRIAVPRGQSRTFGITVRSPARMSLRVRLLVSAFLCHDGAGCAKPPPGTSVQWLDGRTWRTLGASAWRQSGHGMLIGVVRLGPRGQATVRFRVTASRSSVSATGEMDLRVVPDLAGVPGAALLQAPGDWSAVSPIITTDVAAPTR